MKRTAAKAKSARRSTSGRRTAGDPEKRQSTTMSHTAFRVELGLNSYGKSRVRMLKVSRKGRVHTVCELDVAIALHGDFEAIHTRGDNSNCLPTDTMKNTVYALGKDHPLETIEEFARDLARHFQTEHPPAEIVRVDISQVGWKRVRSRGAEHPHCFVRGSGERQTCRMLIHPIGHESIHGGIAGLVLMKTTDSGFSGYPKTRYTTLPETDERVFCTSVTAQWRFGDHEAADYGACREAIRGALIETFAHHKSKSVQHTLYAMGKAALAACPQIGNIRLSMPNKHCLLVNLKPFGLENANEIFVPTDEPHGLIEATIERR